MEGVAGLGVRDGMIVAGNIDGRVDHHGILANGREGLLKDRCGKFAIDSDRVAHSCRELLKKVKREAVQALQRACPGGQQLVGEMAVKEYLEAKGMRKSALKKNEYIK